MQRRTVLAAGLGGLALVGTGATWRVTRTPDSAYQPWAMAGEDELDIRLDAFRHAILAPNPHNRQPWLIELVGDNEALISCDLERRLPVTDPFDRQITIGFGTFLEIARIAARQRGFAMQAELFPAGEAEPRLDARPIARLTFAADDTLTPDPLFDAITIRRSNKEPYDLEREVSAQSLSEVMASGGDYAATPEVIEPLRQQILEAIRIEMTTRDAYMESVDLMRVGYQEVAASPDGIDLTGPMIEGGILTGQISHEQLADMTSSAYKIGLDQTSEAYGSVPALIWITTPANTRRDQIEAGRQYVRANLRAAQLGLAMHPMSQSLQEYPEVAGTYTSVHELLGASGDERVQMLARIGYGPTVGLSPRWPVESLLR